MKTKTKYVVYVVSVCSVKISGNSKEEVVKQAANIVMNRLHRVDSNVFISKAAVMEAEEDRQEKENLANKAAPWLTEGQDGSKNKPN